MNQFTPAEQEIIHRAAMERTGSGALRVLRAGFAAGRLVEAAWSTDALRRRRSFIRDPTSVWSLARAVEARTTRAAEADDTAGRVTNSITPRVSIAGMTVFDPTRTDGRYLGHEEAAYRVAEAMRGPVQAALRRRRAARRSREAAVGNLERTGGEITGRVLYAYDRCPACGGVHPAGRACVA